MSIFTTAAALALVSSAVAASAGSDIKTSNSQALVNIPQGFQSGGSLQIAPGANAKTTVPDGFVASAAAASNSALTDAMISPASRDLENALSGRNPAALRSSQLSQQAIAAAPEGMTSPNGFAAITSAAGSKTISSPALQGLTLKAIDSEEALRHAP